MKELLRRRWFKLLLVVLAIGAGVGVWWFTRPVYHIRISRETTYLTGPLRPDGTVDYLAAIEANQGEGVTPENNAAVLLLQAFGPEMLEAEVRDEAVRRMGTTLPDANGDYFLDLGKYVEHLKSLSAEELEALHIPKKVISTTSSDQREREAATRPWKADEFPEIAAYLTASERPLALVVQASRRPRFYTPLVSTTGNGKIFDALKCGNGTWQFRSAAIALAARATAKLSAGDVGGAWSDLLACHRLARMVAGQRTLITWLVGRAVEQFAMESDAALFAHAKIDAGSARKMLADFRALPAFPSLAKALEGERFWALDTAAMCAVEGVENANAAVGSAPGSSTPRKPPKPDTSVDWNRAMIRFNLFYDSIEQASQSPPPEANSLVLEIGRQMDAFKQSVAPKGGGWFDHLASKLGLDWSEDDLLKITGPESLVALVAPGLGRVVLLKDVLEMHIRLTELGFALTAFGAEKGQYPAKLDELVPEYVPAIPMDSFSGQPLNYRKAGKGFILYSVGLNMVDDGGVNSERTDQGDIVLSVEE